MPTNTLTKKPLTARKSLEQELKTLHREISTEDRAATKALKALTTAARKKIAKLTAAARIAEKEAAAEQARYDKRCSQLDLARDRKNKGRAKRIAILESRLAAI